MDFLTTAVFGRQVEDTENLVGAVVTSYDDTSCYKRPIVHYVSRDELVSGVLKQPMGFGLSDEGALMSDTRCRRVFSKNITDYMCNNELLKSVIPVGLVDIVLLGAEFGAHIVHKPHGSDTYVQIPLSSFKVSESSFNIYAAYGDDTVGFRTFSMLDIETKEKTIPFIIALPKEHLDSFESVMPLLTPIQSEEDGFLWFKSEAALAAPSMFMGEAFVHYVSYATAYFRLGIQIMKDLLSDTKVVSVPVKKIEYDKKYPLRNVRIDHSIKKACTSTIIATMPNPDSLQRLVAQSDEAFATYAWLREIMTYANSAECPDGEDKIYTACMTLQPMCRRNLLRHSLELLTQRYYICKCGRVEDDTPTVFKGGGVCGSSVKKFVG